MSYRTHTEQRILWGEMFFKSFYRLIQTAKIYQDNNESTQECISEFVKASSQVGMGEDLEIHVTRGKFYLQEDKLLYRRENAAVTNNMLELFEQRGIQGLCLYPSIEKAPSDEIASFARLLNYSADREDPVEWLVQKIKSEAITWVKVLEDRDESLQDRNPNFGRRARRTYSYTLSSIKEVAQKISQKDNAGIRKARRVAQNMVDLVSERESLFLALSTIKDYDDYTFTHSVNVAVLCVCLGKRIGLSRNSLEHLGICGLFHDLGKVELPTEIIHKTEALNEQEWEVVRKHPLWSVRQILKMCIPHELKSKILLAPFEHHLKFDLSGYPQVDFKKSISLFGKILAIADVYDAATSPRCYTPDVFSPDQALKFMMDKAGKDFDVNLLQVFVNMVGIYPVGTLLQLSTGEIGLVLDCPSGRDTTRPRIVLLVENGECNFERGEVVDLANQGPEEGSFRRNIVKGLNPATYGIQPAQFLL